MLLSYLISALGGAALATPPNVVLVSMDTTRADALSCYREMFRPTRGSSAITPRIDAIAAEGIRFERFYATAPSTLSSHTTMLSGTDQHDHGVVRNGFIVHPEVPLLPERLRGAGYDTIGVVAAAALEERMGLGRGFRVYDDDLHELQGLMYQEPADHVVQRVFEHVDARPAPAEPLFLFVHFYDPHAPYEPPPAYRDRVVDPDYRGVASASGAVFKGLVKSARRGTLFGPDIQRINELYLAEVAFMDAQIGVLVDGLRARGLLDDALLVLVADHGETLAEETLYSWSHGSNVAYEVMRVPLVVRGYGMPVAQRAVVDSQASMTGLAPTIERAVGLPATMGVGHDFFDLLRPGPWLEGDGWPARPTIPVFMEATRPRFAEADLGWNNAPLHRALFAGGWAVWRAPFLDQELAFYDVGGLPHESVLATLDGLLQAWDDRSPPHREAEMAPSTERALRALGYLDD